MTECTGRRVRMETLDDIVVGAIADHILEPIRLRALLQTFIDRSEHAQGERRQHLRTRMTLLDGESANVIKLVRLGRIAADDPPIEAGLGNIDAQKRALVVDIEMIERQLADGGRNVTPDVVGRLGNLSPASSATRRITRGANICGWWWTGSSSDAPRSALAARSAHCRRQQWN